MPLFKTKGFIMNAKMTKILVAKRNERIIANFMAGLNKTGNLNDCLMNIKRDSLLYAWSDEIKEIITQKVKELFS